MHRCVRLTRLIALACAAVMITSTSGCEEVCDLAERSYCPGLWFLGQPTWSPGHYAFRLVADGVELSWNCTVQTPEDVPDCGGVGTMEGFELSVFVEPNYFLAILQRTPEPEAPAETRFTVHKDGVVLVDEQISIDIEGRDHCDEGCERVEVDFSHPGTMWPAATG